MRKTTPGTPQQMDNRHFTPELTVRLQSKPSAAQSKVNERAPLSTYSPVAAGLTAGRTELSGETISH